MAALCLLPLAASAATTAIRFGTLIDGKGGVLKDAVVVLNGERIQSIGTSVPPSNSRTTRACFAVFK